MTLSVVDHKRAQRLDPDNKINIYSIVGTTYRLNYMKDRQQLTKLVSQRKFNQAGSKDDMN